MILLDVRDPITKKLLFRYDPASNVVQIAIRGQVREIYLETIRQKHFEQIASSLSVPNASPENAAERQETHECREFTAGARTG